MHNRSTMGCVRGSVSDYRCPVIGQCIVALDDGEVSLVIVAATDDVQPISDCTQSDSITTTADWRHRRPAVRPRVISVKSTLSQSHLCIISTKVI